ncbi:hypothetical protein EJC51_22375 [Streptomyces aquilus]|uniref:Uncharacterized protein n=1 Tax=Streptomyces aquilus TaxID=2548456 RepID=A0A3S9I2K8_9ACTN|nr:hypothetical protein [Streptomyces aquilus]AZP18589.1 hypothetical protein EJC51_22375 [Streptomyces aquilus]
MTQSGQGEEPSPRVAREGIVLPSDGGEPLLPGMTGVPAGGSHVPAPAPSAPPAAPPGAQAWGTPWGPDQQAPAPQQPAPGDGWGASQGRPWGAPDPYQTQTPNPYQAQTPDPYQGEAPGSYQGESQGSYQAHAPGSGPYQGQAQAPDPYQAQPPGYQTDQPTSYYLPPVGQTPPAPQPLPQENAPAPQPSGYDADQATSYYLPPVAQTPPASQPLPQENAPAPQPSGYDADQATSYYLPPVGQPLPTPPGADPYGAPAGPGAATGAPLPPADEGATQYIPPVTPGALPPEVPGERTQFLGQPPQGPAAHGQGAQAGPGGVPHGQGAQAGPGAGPLPPVSGPDAEATQYIPPVTGQHGGERQPPAEFDNLFRSGTGGEGPAGATQVLPRFEPEPAQPQQSYVPPTGAGRRAAQADERDHSGPTRSRVPAIAAVGIGIAVLGIGAGALLASGGGDDKGDDNKPVSATAPASEGSASPSTDAAKEQAVALDKLLADSGDSRASVISAVGNVKACKDLGQAATDLRDAAGQRNDLVTSLSGLSVGQLPNHSELTTALTKAWKASASADNHYAAWADQVAGNKKACKKGQARSTPQTLAGNQASGEATIQKKTAARLWNAIARKYGLTERTYTQL